jgi:AraC-like DNA-binding protein
MRELANQVVDLEALLGRAGAELTERLYEAPGWGARFALLDAALTARMSEVAPLGPAVTHAWQRLTESAGAAPIGALAAEIGCSRRHLSATFSEHVGLPPKRLARVLRFARVAAGLQQRRPLAELAYACGYADQAHLNRDFRELAGVTPTAYEASLLSEGGGVAA